MGAVGRGQPTAVAEWFELFLHDGEGGVTVRLEVDEQDEGGVRAGIKDAVWCGRRVYEV